MASDGLTNKAKHGKCRICQRIRKTDTYVKSVGEVRHGFATGHIWECIDSEDCDRAANEKLKNNTSRIVKAAIENSLKIGRFTDYKCFS